MKKLFTLSLLSFSLFANAQQFDGNNLVVLKISSPTAIPIPATGTSRQVSLVEYTRTGTLVQTKTVPSTGANKYVVEDRRIAHEGQLSLSTDEKYLTAVGYDAGVGIAATPLRELPKVVIRIDQAGKIDYSTKIPPKNAFKGAGVRGAVTVDGSKYYVNSGAPGTAQGMREINHGDTSSTNLSEKQYRSIGLAGGVLFGITQDAPAIMEGDGTKLDIPEMTGDLTQFVFFDADKNEGWNGTGLDLLYIANRNSGIRKYYYDGIKWVFVSIYNTTIANATGFVAMTGNLEGGLPTFYAIKVLEADNSSYLIKVQDKTGPKENWNVTGKYPNVTELASAVGTEMFRGIAFAPGKKTVSAKDLNAELVSLTIKPNVAQNEIRVVLPENGGLTTKVNVFNLQGSNVINTQGAGEITIDINALPAGLYFVKTAEGAQGKFIKQ